MRKKCRTLGKGRLLSHTPTLRNFHHGSVLYEIPLWLVGTLLTVDEVARWVVHAAQLPQDMADTFRSNTVTGYDFPELAANQVRRRYLEVG